MQRGSVSGPCPVSIDAYTQHTLGMLAIMQLIIPLGIRHHFSCNARPSCCKLLQHWGLLPIFMHIS